MLKISLLFEWLKSLRILINRNDFRYDSNHNLLIINRQFNILSGFNFHNAVSYVKVIQRFSMAA